MLTPRPYQIEGRDFLASRRHALLADEMRVGKTPQAIMACHKLDVQDVLVLCPAIAVPHWAREFRRWYDALGAMLLPSLTVLSYDMARNNMEGLLRRWYDVMIVDEAHFAKNPEAARTRMVYGKGGLGHRASRLWALSGTPAPRHAGELWPMLRAFGVVGMDYEAFTRRYCTYNPYTDRITGTKEKHIPELKALLAEVMLRRTRKDVAPDMPAIGFEFLEMKPLGFDLPAAADADDQDSVDTEDRIEVAKAKAKQLAPEIIDSINNKLYAQTVVFGWHKEPLAELSRALLEAGVRSVTLTGDTPPRGRETIQGEFRDGRIKVICANILAAGTAIDLSAASHGHFLELDWVSGNNLQAANRLVSMDKKEPVTFDICTWPGSVDDRIQKVLVRRVKELAQLY